MLTAPLLRSARTLATVAVLTAGLAGCSSTTAQQAADKVDEQIASNLQKIDTKPPVAASLQTWTKAFDGIKQAQVKAFPNGLPAVTVTDKYTRLACDVLRKDLPVVGGPTGSAPVDPLTTLRKAGFLSAFAASKNEPNAKILNSVVNTALGQWNDLAVNGKKIASDPFAPMTAVCTGVKVTISPAPNSSPTR